jgi:hypothetical protein
MVRHVERTAISLQIHNLAQKISCTAYTYSQLSVSTARNWSAPCVESGESQSLIPENLFLDYPVLHSLDPLRQSQVQFRYARLEQIRILPAREVTIFSAITSPSIFRQFHYHIIA